MKRQYLALAALAAVLLVVLFWLLVWQPQREELAEIEEQIVTQQLEQQRLQLELDGLRRVRERAPEVEAQLAAAAAVVPPSTAIPAALRQLQMAADEAGITLQSLSASPPTQVPNATDGLSQVDVNLQVLGGYFQLVDFLRRIEDPAITPRAIRWGSSTITRSDYPTLTVGLSGSMYAFLAAPPPPPPPDDDPDDADTEVEIDIDTEGDG